MPVRYAVLSDDVGLDELLREVAEALEGGRDAEAAERHEPEMIGEGVVTYAWEAPVAGWMVALTDDPEGSGRSLMIEADSEDEVQRLAEALLVRLPVERLAGLREAAAGLDPRALTRLALAQGSEPEPESLEIIRRALASSDDDVLEAGIESAAVTRAPALVPDLEGVVSREDLSEEQRLMLAHAIADCAGGAG